MTKEERAKKAKKHIEQMLDRHKEDIEYGIEFSHIYRNNTFKGKIDKPYIFVENITSEEAVINHTDALCDDVCVLNFASFKHPGGGFINGAIAQEEALCHASTLYNVIGDDKFKKEYEYNKTHLNRGLYENFGIFTPFVVFESSKDNRFYYANVVTVAAPNKNVYETFNKDKDSIYNEVLKGRIDFILDIMKKEHQRVLILGAFGCGVFGNDPFEVASIFKKLIENKYRNDFTKIVFAIPGGDNFNAFEKTFKDWKNE